MKIILDTNIVLDILLKREEFYQASYDTVKLSVRDRINAVLPTNIITDVYYVLNRNDKALAKPILEKFLPLVDMCEVIPADITAAFSLEMKDFEDAVVAATAFRVNANYIVTRNGKDFEGSPVPAIEPGDFLDIMPEG